MLSSNDVLGMFEFPMVSGDSDLDRSWIRASSDINMSDRSGRRYWLHYMTFNPITGEDRHWGGAIGTIASWMRVAQDGMNALISFFPFAPGIVKDTGVYDCQTAALNTVARHWYRRDLPVPLPRTTPLEWPEFLLYVQASPAMDQALHYKWNNPENPNMPKLGTPGYRWVLWNPAVYTPAPAPTTCSEWNSQVKGLADTPWPTPVLPGGDITPEIPTEVGGTEGVSAGDQTTATTTQEGGVSPLLIAGGIGLGALALLWALKE